MPRGKTLLNVRLRRNGRELSGRHCSARAVEPRLTWRFLAKRTRVLAVAVHQAEAAQPSRLSERKAPRGFEVRRGRPLGRAQLA
jgi:hypothetical protein